MSIILGKDTEFYKLKNFAIDIYGTPCIMVRFDTVHNLALLSQQWWSKWRTIKDFQVIKHVINRKIVEGYVYLKKFYEDQLDFAYLTRYPASALILYSCRVIGR